MKPEMIQEAFQLKGHIIKCISLPNGKIHETYQIRFESGEMYIFQHMNSNVFSDPGTVMQNIDHVTAYLKQFPDMHTLHFYQTAQQTYLFEGWRVMDYIDGYSQQSLTDLFQIHQAGKAFGRFQSRVHDMDSHLLQSVIPDFHNTDNCFRKLEAFADSSPEYETLMQWRDRACSVMQAYQHIPHMITHNDMKCSNLLFDNNTHQPIAVIDLDTVMSGMAAYDFGDAVRSITSIADPPEIDLKKFQAFASGWLSEMHYTPEEKKLLIPAVFAVTVELAVRYLTDYLQGNIYFKADFPEQTLIRCRNLIHLAENLLYHETEMRTLLKEM